MIVSKKKIDDNAIDIIIDGIKIERVKTMKYLEVMLDENLKMGKHCDYMWKKIARSTLIIESSWINQ